MKLKISKPTVPQILLVVGILGIILSAFLWYSHLTVKVIGCLTGGCEAVLSSPYAKIFGVPIAAMGVAYYVGVLILALFRMFDDRAILVRFFSWGTSLVGIFFSGYYFYLELYKIHAICSWCKVSTTLTIVLFVLALMEIKKFGGVKGILSDVKTLYDKRNG